MAKQSAGILPFKFSDGKIFFLLGHPGGPFYAKKDEGVWSIIKGELNENEEPLQAAKREFLEETSLVVDGVVIPLTSVKMKSGKIVHAYALESQPEITNFKSNLFPMEWPPKSGKWQEFPEIDRIEWVERSTAEKKILSYQLPFINQIVELVHSRK